MKERRIVLFDYLTGGHHLTYVEEFVKSLEQSAIPYHVLFPELDKLNEKYRSNYSTYQSVWADKLSNSLRFKTLGLWIDLIKNLAKIKSQTNDLVFICWMDTFRFHRDNPLVIKFFFLIIRLFGPKEWIGLYFHPTHLRKSVPNKQSYSIDAIFTLPTCKGIAVLDDGIIEMLENRTNKPVFVFPDITNTEHVDQHDALATAVLNKAKGRRIVSLIGMQSKRKGLLTLIDLAKSTEDKDLFYFFAGPLDKPTFNEEELKVIDDFVASQPDNCYFHFHRIQDGPEFNGLVKISSLIYAVYIDFPHSSNLLVKAAYFKKPVLVSDEYYMAEAVARYQLGAVAPPSDLAKIREIIVNNTYICGDENLQEKFYLKNSKETLKNTFQTILKID